MVLRLYCEHCFLRFIACYSQPIDSGSQVDGCATAPVALEPLHAANDAWDIVEPLDQETAPGIRKVLN